MAASRSGRVRMLLAAALLVLAPCGVHAAPADVLSGDGVRLHEGEVVPSGSPTLVTSAGSLRVERSTVGGLAPGRSAGASGIQLDGGVVAVPQPSQLQQEVVAMLVLLSWSLLSSRLSSGWGGVRR